MSSVSPIMIDLGERPWQSAVSDVLGQIEEAWEEDDQQNSYEDPYYPHSRDQLVGELRTALAFLRLLLVLWRIPGRRDDDGVLPEGALWSWLRSWTLRHVSGLLTTSAEAPEHWLAWSNEREVVAEQLRALIPERQRTRRTAQEVAAVYDDHPLDEALDRLEGLCDRFLVGTAVLSSYDDIRDLISDLEIRRWTSAPLMQSPERLMPLDSNTPTEPLDALSAEPMVESLEPIPDALGDLVAGIVPAMRKPGRPPANFSMNLAEIAFHSHVSRFGEEPTPQAIYHALPQTEKDKGAVNTFRTKWSQHKRQLHAAVETPGTIVTAPHR